MLKDKFGFNFWPSFTDLMLSVILVILIILFLVSALIASGNENLEKARENQKELQTQIVNDIGRDYSVAIYNENSRVSITDFMNEHDSDIYIVDKLDRQTITFNDKVLDRKSVV